MAKQTARRAFTGDGWTVLGRGNGFHDDTGDLGVCAKLKPVMLGTDGGIFKPSNSSYTNWVRAADTNSGLNSYQITDIAGTNVFAPDHSYQTSLYFSTQDNAIWASSDGGVTWPNFDCAEGFHVEVRKNLPVGGGSIQVGYGKVGCGPSGSMFGDANLVNQRAVPDVDNARNAISNLGNVFMLSANEGTFCPGTWIRYRNAPMVNPEVFVSPNNGASWRKRAEVPLPFMGVPAVTDYGCGVARVYIPVLGNSTSPDGNRRIGLVKILRPTRTGALTLNESSMIYLPDNGSLGQRATEFDWQAVFGVHPSNDRLIIAPDIVNQVVKITRDGGRTWTTDVNLTREVTKSGTFLIYDGRADRIQVTHISFDPVNENRILVGTRDAGVIISEDQGSSWQTIPGSENILYPTGFFFRPDNTVIACTYGRGLWTINLAIRHFAFPWRSSYQDLVIRRVLPPVDPLGVDFNNSDVLLVKNGVVEEIYTNKVGKIFINLSKGSSYEGYFTSNKIPDFEITYTKIPREKSLRKIDDYKKNDLQVGIIFQNKAVVGVLTGKQIIRDTFPVPKLKKPDSLLLAREEYLNDIEIYNDFKITEPSLFLYTSIMGYGIPILGENDTLMIRVNNLGRLLESCSLVSISIDGIEIKKQLFVTQNGEFLDVIRLPKDLPLGEHTIEIRFVSEDGSPKVLKGKFKKAPLEGGDLKVKRQK